MQRDKIDIIPMRVDNDYKFPNGFDIEWSKMKLDRASIFIRVSSIKQFNNFVFRQNQSYNIILKRNRLQIWKFWKTQALESSWIFWAPGNSFQKWIIFWYL